MSGRGGPWTWLGGLLVGSLGARRAEARMPPMVAASERTLNLCPVDNVVAARAAWGRGGSERVLRTVYDRAVAEWAVCAHLRGGGEWAVPPLDDPLSQALVEAAAAPPFSEDRRRLVRACAQAFPLASALLVMEELQGVAALASRPELERVGALVELYQGWLGPVGCAESETCFGDVAVSLWSLLEPASDHQALLGYALRGWVESQWAAASAVDLAPLDPVPVALAKLGVPGGVGVGAPWRTWVRPGQPSELHRRAPALHPTLGLVGYAAVERGPLVPPPTEAQELWIDGSTPMGEVARECTDTALGRALWVVETPAGARGLRIELGPPGTGVLPVGEHDPWQSVVTSIENLGTMPMIVRVNIRSEGPVPEAGTD